MKVHILDLNPDLDVTIAGDEPWLSPIYGDFLVPAESEKPAAKISGHIKVHKVTDDVIRVSGEITYNPLVSCSRCVETIAWPLSESIDVYFQRRGQSELPSDITLRKGELDEYYFENDEIDVGEVINDTIQTALPTRFLCEDANGTTCNISRNDLDESQVYGRPSSEDDQDNPFAVLKDLKTKH